MKGKGKQGQMGGLQSRKGSDEVAECGWARNVYRLGKDLLSLQWAAWE